MARRYAKPTINRGEDFDEPQFNINYDYRPQSQSTAQGQERAIRRHEIMDRYDEQFRLEQQRDQRTFARTNDMRNEFYAGIDPRRRQEVADSGMIREDHTKMANCPTEPLHYEYSRFGYYETPYNADQMRGEDPFRDDDNKF